MVKEVDNSGEFNSIIRGPGLVVVDYFATWCGPCRQIAPFIEQLAQKYPNVTFIKVDSDKSSISQERGITALPTFQFFVGGNQVDELKGANANGIESRVIKFKVDVNPWAGQGFTLGNSQNTESSSDSVRDARVRALQTASQNSNPKQSSVAPSVHNENGENEIVKQIVSSMHEVPKQTVITAQLNSDTVHDKLDMEAAMAEQQAEDSKWGEEMIPVPVPQELLQQLIEMGFSDTVSRKGLVHGKSSIEEALSWIAEHQDDPDIDQAYMVRKSDVMEKPVLTEEEKEKKMLELKEKIRVRKENRVREEKANEIKREKERRESGQKIGEIQEERDRLGRKRELEKQKKEKLDAERERERLRQEIARDKELRKLNKGVLPSVLGVDGYNPSLGQSAPAAGPPAAVAPQPSVTVVQAIDNSILTVSRYRTAGDGGKALALLITFVRNVHDNPHELKYRSINMESNAFKTKLAPLTGPTVLLKSLGFKKLESEEKKLLLEGDIDQQLFGSTLQKLLKAEETYNKMNSY